MFLKWEDELLGIIDSDSYEVKILNPHLNPTVERLFHGKSIFSAEEWHGFLSDRIVSKDRRDIEKILFYCGLSRYDVFKIAEFTRAFNVKDKCWIAFDDKEIYAECLNKYLGKVFLKNHDIEGNIVSSPGGQQIKKYGFLGDKFGIYKKRLHPSSTDVESEVAVFYLAEKMGVPCCPAVQVDTETVFSEYLYDFNHESFIHFRNLFPDGSRGENDVENILKIRPQYEVELFQMLVLDFITHQDDRHLSNFAIKISGDVETFYPLYDNGRSLFFEDTEKLVEEKCSNPIFYCNSFGPVGTQWDALNDMLLKNPSLIKTVNLEISDEDIDFILKSANITGYRYDGAKVWIRKSIETLKELTLSIDEIGKDEHESNYTVDNKNHNDNTKVSIDNQILSAANRVQSQAASEAKLKEHVPEFNSERQ